MADVVTVYNRNGIPLAELPVSVVREYRAESTIQVGRGSFKISARDPKATRKNLDYNNIVVVRSDLGVPNWAGLIWTPTVIKNGEITVNLRAAEWLLGQRMISTYTYGAVSAGELFRSILQIAQTRGSFPLSDDWSGISTGGNENMEGEFNEQSCYDAANTVANQTGYYWSFAPSTPAANQSLEFRPFFKQRVGRNYSRPLVAGVTLVDIELQEIGDLCNYLTVYARMRGYTEPILAISQVEKSIGRFGAVEDIDSNLTVYSSGAVQSIADSMVNDRAYPKLRISATVTDRPFPLAGDRVPVELGLGYAYLSRKSLIYCRVKTSRYDPNSNTVTLVMDEEIDNE